MTARSRAFGVIGLPIRFRISSNPSHSASGISLGGTKAGGLAARFFGEDVVFGEVVVLDGLGAKLAGVAVVFGRGADLSGVPDWQG